MPDVDFMEMRASNVRREFTTRRRRYAAVDGIDLAVAPGTAIGVVGESGSGKSTLARMMVGLDRPTEGSVALNGRLVSDWLSDRHDRLAFRRVVQYVPQDTTSSFDPRRTLRDSVRMPLLTLFGLSTREADDRVDTLVASMGLDPAMADRKPGHVSGGQRQRFALARALIVEPRVVVCDEVVSALDVSVQGTILNLLKAYLKERLAALVFVSHGLPATAFISSELVVMNAGKVVEHGPTDTVVEEPQHPYTRSLLAAYRLSETSADRSAS